MGIELTLHDESLIEVTHYRNAWGSVTLRIGSHEIHVFAPRGGKVRIAERKDEEEAA